ncbi:MAG: helix-turn-helix domain-containing protein [Burkholderiales bacterium]
MAELNAAEIFERAKSVAGARTDSELATHFGKTANQISVWRQRNTIPIEPLLAFADSQNLSLRWLLTGDGQIATSDRIDVGQFVEIQIATRLGYEHSKFDDSCSRAALRLAFGSEAHGLSTALAELDEIEVMQRIERAFDNALPGVAAAVIYNQLQRTDLTADERTSMLLWGAAMTGAPPERDPVAEQASRLIRVKRRAVMDRAQKRLIEAKARSPAHSPMPTEGGETGVSKRGTSGDL